MTVSNPLRTLARCPRCVRHNSTKANTTANIKAKTNVNGSAKDDEESGGGYMKRRLQQLAEDATPTSADPLAGHIEDAIPYNKIELHSRLDEIVNNPSNFQYNHQQAIGISKLPTGASKHVRDIAMSKPWQGVESHYDASLRMLNESIKPLRVKKSNGRSTNTIITPPKPVRSRIHDAREGSLDYKLAKMSQAKVKDKKGGDEEDDGWGEMYRERLLGPSMLLNDSFASVDNSIKSLADQKIMDAQRRGEFENIKRGKPLDKGYGAMENMFIDRTEFHLNEILKKQDALPPWIERQGGSELLIQRFRQELDKSWVSWAPNHIKDVHPNVTDDTLIEKMGEYASLGGTLRSKEWVKAKKPYWEAQLRDLNDTIRGYNLQAPLASQKLYLQLDKELNACYKRTASLLVPALKRHLRGDDTNDNGYGSGNPVALTYNGIPQRTDIKQRDSESLWSMFCNIVK